MFLSPVSRFFSLLTYWTGAVAGGEARGEADIGPALRDLCTPCLAFGKPSTPLSQLPRATKAGSVAKGSPKALEFTVNCISVFVQTIFPAETGEVDRIYQRKGIVDIDNGLGWVTEIWGPSESMERGKTVLRKGEDSLF